jgi:hypothetical protein
LNWEDKELVLRVLFAKMNGASGELPKAKTLGKKSFANTQPVFVSEGANLPGNVSSSLGYFEVHNHGGSAGDLSPDEGDQGFSHDYNDEEDEYEQQGNADNAKIRSSFQGMNDSPPLSEFHENENPGNDNLREI